MRFRQKWCHANSVEARRSVVEGISPKTLAVGGLARRKAVRAMFNRRSVRYRVGLMSRNSVQHTRNVRSGTPTAE